MMNFRYLRLLAGFVIVGLLAFGLAALVSHHSQPPRPRAAATAPASQPQDNPVDTPLTPQQQAFLNWYQGPGNPDFEAVSSDLTALDNDVNNSYATLFTLENDGAQLATDARAALKYPMPIDTAEYNLAMASLVVAGQDTANDELTAAQAPLKLAGSLLNKINPDVQNMMNILEGFGS